VNVKRYVNIGFVFGGLIAWMILAPFFAWALELISPKVNFAILGADFRLSNILGLAAAVAGTALLFAKESVHTGAIEIANELSKVTWPKWTETRNATTIVIITTIIVALILGLFDLVWAKVTGWIYG
jgi:preprotein translocase subunit SecE